MRVALSRRGHGQRIELLEVFKSDGRSEQRTSSRFIEFKVRSCKIFTKLRKALNKHVPVLTDDKEREVSLGKAIRAKGVFCLTSLNTLVVRKERIGLASCLSGSAL